ncbi:YkgJ family cysteine cluster protein [Paramagnetospirillum magneticum]|uniref:YkgJ family cysteine cluster protein n=1 Tax=Paramagnetospirillum magneticum TaxID=84159 RepID=UPI0002D64831|nr:YkgJ family cysteine cluster protein [Paramagnetospirillum magneticum]
MAGLGYSDVRRQAAAAASQALAQGKSPADSARAAIAAADAFFDRVRQALKLDEQLARQACAAGCSWCCHQIVAITAAELDLVAQAIAAKPPEAQAAITARARDAAAKGTGLDQRQWWAARIRCPLLEDDGLCGIHAARPLPCRAHNSADAGACRRSFEGEAVRTPVLAAQQGVWAHAQMGLAEALQGSGHSAEAVNLALAVDGLLSKAP